MAAQKTMNALDQALNRLHDACQSFKGESKAFRKDMHVGFDSLDKHFDEIDELLDASLNDAKAISKYMDSIFNFVFFTIGVVALYVLSISLPYT